MSLRKLYQGKKPFLALSMALLLSMGLMAGCGQKSETAEPAKEPAAEEPAKETGLSGSIAVDGSSTVYPITSAVAEDFQKMNPDVKITVGFSGTGGGFEKFIAGETVINDASRSIKDKEKTALEEKGIEYVELKVAIDGLSVVINPENDWVDHLTIEELKKMWEPDSKVKTWKDVRASFPAEPIKFFAPGADSGTFEYFTEAVIGKAGAIRTEEMTPSEDDNVLVNGVAGEKGGIGFFGYSYYEENKDKLKVVPVDAGKGAIEPNATTVQDGTYAPLSRPLFMYVRKDALDKPEVKAFLEYYLTEGKAVIPEVGYVALPDGDYTTALDAIK